MLRFLFASHHWSPRPHRHRAQNSQFESVLPRWLWGRGIGRGAEPSVVPPPLPDPLPHILAGEVSPVIHAFLRQVYGGEGTKTGKKRNIKTYASGYDVSRRYKPT